MYTQVFTRIIILMISLCIFSCASIYTINKTDHTEYDLFDEQNGIQIKCDKSSYLINANKKLKQKALKSNIWFIPTQVSNTTNDTLKLKEGEVLLFSNNLPLDIVSENLIYKDIRQKKGWYSLYILAGPWYITNDEFVYYPVFPLVGLYNFIKANKSNNYLTDEFLPKNIINRMIPPNSSFEGWICIKGIQTDDLFVRLNKDVKK